MAKGRKPTPSYLKLVKGNPGRRRLNAAEPKPELALPTVPPHLSDEAKVEWGRLANELYSLGLLTRIDRAGLAAYCQVYSDWVEAEAMIRKTGTVIKSPIKTTVHRKKDGSEVTESTGGYPMQSPFLAIRNKCLELMHKYLVEFGMTPSSRTRVNTTAGNGGLKRPDDPSRKYFAD